MLKLSQARASTAVLATQPTVRERRPSVDRRPRNLSEIRLRLEDAVRDIPIERVVTVVVAEIDLEAARAIQQDAELLIW